MIKQLVTAGLSIAGCMSIGMPASAVLIYELNYDSVSPSYDQLDNGGVTTKTYTATGDAGTQAVQLDFDTSGLSGFQSISYFANINATPLAAPTSADPADYELSFEVKADGLKAGQSSAGGQAEIKLGDAVFRGDYNAIDTYSTITFNLGDMTPIGAGTFEFADITTSVQFKANSLGIVDKFDADSGNVLRFDNWRLTEIVAVPEASSFVTLSLLGLGYVARVDRRKRRI